ncbi:phage Gp37/Gp68 family protein [Cytophagaceae bacterium DM2B3-1]|uniref:Phage Gp37/Gp68 family protein n=1 Tax=Xanthocytophaga flava TaxID=3048013 RepID=A0ABT7CS39_9BACT|nr:phage Gp37/Gp68 family protein [Xanthocytophaga flavus]MDJ1496563.1 phage Gp37/Gp68 family protein [Xanthocytophaga flavus]
MAHSEIEWTEQTWNPTTGCTKISQGCKFCYAEIMAKRLKAMGVSKYKDGFKVRLHEDVLDAPKQWKPSVIFVNSMSDLFHEDIPLEYIQKVFKVMNECTKHQFQVLTKRSDLLAKYSEHLTWTDNIWMGVSVENQRVAKRIDDLRKCGAKIKFLSLEPLIGPLSNLNLIDINWVIVGGESGWKARPIRESWVIDIRNQCKNANIPFFFKQWGGVNKKATGRTLEGQTYDEMPVDFKQLA